MDVISLKPLYHRGSETIAIYAPDLPAINLAIRKVKGVKWSQTHKVWYTPWGKDMYEQIFTALKPMATIDTKELLHYLNRKNTVKNTLVPSSSTAPETLTRKTFLLHGNFQRKQPLGNCTRKTLLPLPVLWRN